MWHWSWNNDITIFSIKSKSCIWIEGRRRELILAALLYLVGALVTAVAPSFVVLVIGRFVFGIGIGLVTNSSIFTFIFELFLNFLMYFYVHISLCSPIWDWYAYYFDKFRQQILTLVDTWTHMCRITRNSIWTKEMPTIGIFFFHGLDLKELMFHVFFFGFLFVISFHGQMHICFTYPGSNQNCMFK